MKKNPSPFLYFACFVLVLGVILHSKDRNEEPGLLLAPLIVRIPNNQILAQFVDALEQGNTTQLESCFATFQAENFASFLNAFRSGRVTDLWGIERQADVLRFAFRVRMQYDKKFSMTETGDALFVFRSHENEWRLEWFAPGAILLAPREVASK